MTKAKRHGQYFTPPDIAATLVRWALRSDTDRILDPACGDGEFLASHEYAVGCELDAEHAYAARLRAPGALVHGGDFFAWADETQERFEAVVGNPPFIRYQGFIGDIRERALRQARKFGADLSALTSSWAPFIAASALLLRPGGRMAFVVPAEIGHATYAVPLIEALCAAFGEVVIIAVREKIFPTLAEDAWILYVADHGGKSLGVRLVSVDQLTPDSDLPSGGRIVPISDLRKVRGRLRRWLLPSDVLSVYESFEQANSIKRLGSLASVSIGYVSGANDFFHLRPSVARRARIEQRFLVPTVRKGGSLPPSITLTKRQVQRWITNDDEVLLLHLRRDEKRLPIAVRRYLDSDAGLQARAAYKCRVREPWYAVPDVKIPDGFLTVMSGDAPQIIRNAAGCAGTNSVHVIKMSSGKSFSDMQAGFSSILTRLSCEIEGHPLGGGLLKMEPREAQRLLIPDTPGSHALRKAEEALRYGIATMKAWRGYE
jgi:adenine-specific DNA-methyltransferase